MVTIQPVTPTNVSPGNPVVLSATATDADSWKWMKGNANVPGATGTGSVATLNIQSAQTSDTGNYKAVFTNALGTVNSNIAVVTVA